MANLYWYGGSGNWSDYANHWSNNSGNSPSSPAAAAPTSSDNVIFNASSGTGTVTVNAVANCADADFSTSSILTVAGSSTWNVYGSLTFKAGMTLSYNATIVFAATATGKTFTTGANTINCSLTFNGAGGGWTLQDNIAFGGALTLTVTNGGLNINGKTINYNISNNGWTFIAGGAGTTNSSITCGAATFTNCKSFTIGSTGTCTFTANTLTINYTQLTNSISFSTAVALALYNFANSTASVTLTFSGAGSYSFNNFSNTSAGAELVFSSPITVNGTLTITGTYNYSRTWVNSGTYGTARTISAAAVSLTNVDFMDITAAGATPWTGTSLGDAGRNSNITFTATKPCYWVGNGGNWNDPTNHWASVDNGTANVANYPLPQDTVYITANSVKTAAQTINLTGGGYFPSIDFTNVANSPTVTWTTCRFTGSLIFKAGQALTTTNYGWTFYGKSASTFSTGGTSMASNTNAFAFYGDYTLGSDINLTGASSVTKYMGTFDANDKNLTLKSFSTSGSPTIYLGNGTWTIVGTSGGFTTSTATIYGEGSTIVFSATGTSAKSFTGGNKTFNNVTIATDNVTMDANTFNTLAVNTTNMATGLKLSGNITVDNLTTNGVAGALAKLVSSSGGTKRTITLSGNGPMGRRVSVNYTTITDSTGAGGEFFAGGGSVLSNTTGWINNPPPPRKPGANLAGG